MGRVIGALVGLLVMIAAADADERRFALIVGVGDYLAPPANPGRPFANIPKLDNPIPDANLISQRLREDGFDVVVQTDPGRADMFTALQNFTEKVDTAKRNGDRAIALFYFAGHGMQDRRKANWLIPRDAKLAAEIDLPLQAVDLGDILKQLQYAGPDVAFAIIDACRDTPLPERALRGDLTQGLAVPGEGRGILIAFSAEPGKRARDGEPGGNSPFAAALAKQLGTPGIDASAMFNVVAQDVLRDTQQAQFPRVFPGLTQPFVFKASANPAASQLSVEEAVGKGTTNTPVPPIVAPTIELNLCDNDYGAAVLENTQRSYDAFLRKCVGNPKEQIVKKLRQRLIEDELWGLIEKAPNTSDRINRLQRLITAYPESDYVPRARDMLVLLTPRAPPPPPPPLPAPTPIIVPVAPLVAPPVPVPSPLSAPVVRVTFHRSEDAPGNDLDARKGVNDENDCARLCEQLPACGAFTFNTRHGVCFRKTRVSELKPFPDAITGVLNGRSAVTPVSTSPRDPVLVRHPNRDAPGNDLGGGKRGWITDTTEAQCRAVCVSNPNCAGYTFNFTRNNTCIQKSAIGALKPHPDNAITVEVIRR